jgi:hypothetical protein
MPRPGPALTAPALTLAYLGPAALAFVVAAAAVPWLAPELAGHYYHPRVLALTHTVTLGWVTLTIMGASYQLTPIVLQRPVWSARLARGQLALMIIGVIGMVSHFLIAEWSGLVWGAGLVTLGIAAHVVNIGMAVRGVEPRTLTSAMFTLALGGLAATAGAGLALGVDRIVPFLSLPFFPRLQAHFHLAVLGWVMPMVLGVGARVYPIFMHAPAATGWPLRAQLWGLVCGVPLTVVGVALAAPAVTIAGGLAVAAAVTGHLASLLRMTRARRGPAFDGALRFVITGAGMLAVAMLMGLGFALNVLDGPRLGLAYAILVLGGWVSLTIVGMMLRIVPFLVWYRVYAPLAGRLPVPALADLSWPWAERCTYALLTTGTIALSIAAAAGDAAWIRATGFLLLAGALTFALAIGAPISRLGRRCMAPPATGPAHSSA